MELFFLVCVLGQQFCDHIPAAAAPFSTLEKCATMGGSITPRMKVNGYVCLPVATKSDREPFTPKTVTPEIFRPSDGQ